VNKISGAFAAGFIALHRRHRWAAFTKATLACALVAGASSSVLLFERAAPSGATTIAQQITDLQAQAAQISSSMLLEQLQIGGYQQQYNEAVARVGRDQLLIAQTERAIGRDQHELDRDAATLRVAAVKAYENGGNSSVTPIFTDASAADTANEYQRVLQGTVTGAVDQLHSAKRSLNVQEASLQVTESQDQTAQNQAQLLLSESDTTEQRLQQQSQQVKGQLAAAVAVQQQQEQAAAEAALAAARAHAAAVAAAQAAAAQQAQLVTNRVPTAAVTRTGQIPALNSFLQCVVQAESSGNYQAVSPTGQYMGAFQFSQSTWNEAAQLAGMPNLVGVAPNTATPAEQNALAIALYSADGSAPWYDPCTGR